MTTDHVLAETAGVVPQLRRYSATESEAVNEPNPAPVPPPSRYLTAAQTRRVYDRIGRIQDLQAVYEHRAINTLVAHADFTHAHAVCELGHGTGALAERLLRTTSQRRPLHGYRPQPAHAPTRDPAPQRIRRPGRAPTRQRTPPASPTRTRASTASSPPTSSTCSPPRTSAAPWRKPAASSSPAACSASPASPPAQPAPPGSSPTPGKSSGRSSRRSSAAADRSPSLTTSTRPPGRSATTRRSPRSPSLPTSSSPPAPDDKSALRDSAEAP